MMLFSEGIDIDVVSLIKVRVHRDGRTMRILSQNALAMLLLSDMTVSKPRMGLRDCFIILQDTRSLGCCCKH